MYVQVNRARSSSRNLPCSVPQGSIAGPVLFNAYASTLSDSVLDPSTCVMAYADDHIIYRSFCPQDGELASVTSLQETLVAIKHWMDQNKLKMNSAKTEFIYFGSHHQLGKCNITGVVVDQSIVERSSSIKYLGVIFDEQLRFENHISTKCRVASYNLYHIASIRKHLTMDSAKSLASTMVLSHLDYCNSLLYGLPASTLKRIQRIQNRAAKIVLQRSRHDSRKRALYDLHWLPINYRIEYKIALLVFKCLHGAAPKYLVNLISLRDHVCVIRSTSQGSILKVPSTSRKTFADRSFSVCGPKVWNALPCHIRTCDDIDNFRKLLKTHYFVNAFIVI